LRRQIYGIGLVWMGVMPELTTMNGAIATSAVEGQKDQPSKKNPQACGLPFGSSTFGTYVE